MKFQLFGILFIVPVTLFLKPALQAQESYPITDCLGAQVLCSDSSFVFLPQGFGIDDFANPKNDEGCLTNFEVQSAWYYFEFQRRMPRGSKIQFLITPTSPVAPGVNRDFDFAIYGPDLLCDSLGSPLRCSETFSTGMPTGLDSTATENSERGVFPIEDGLVADLEVEPGAGYYLLLSNWDMSPTEFTISWGGSAAKWLNCAATPGCDFYAISAGRDTTLCPSDLVQQIVLEGDTTGVGPDLEFYWTALSGSITYLDDTLSLNPILTIPAGFSGYLSYVLNVGSGSCVSSDTVQIYLPVLPERPLPLDTFLCANTTLSLNALSPALSNYSWSDGSMGPEVLIDRAGNYQLSALDTNNCVVTYDFSIEEKALPVINLPADTFFCRNGAPIQFEFGDQFETYLWSDGSTASNFTAFFTQNLGLTVSDEFGCTASDSIFVEAIIPPNTQVLGERLICEGGSTTLTVADSTLRYRWSTGDTGRSLTVTEAGVYSVQVQDSLFGCSNFYIIQVRTASPFNVSITGDRNFCPGQETVLGVEGDYVSYQWSTGDSNAELPVSQEGRYQVTVTDAIGCTGTGEIGVQQHIIGELTLPDSLFFCPGSNVELNTNSLFERYQWSDGVTTLNRSFAETGIFSIQALSSEGCPATDYIYVKAYPAPLDGISGDSILCLNDTLSLSVPDGLTAILWSNGATTPAIAVTQAGQYSVTISDDNSCQSDYRFTVTDANSIPPDPSIEHPGGICPGSEAVLSSSGNYAAYLWSTGASTSSINISNSGTYTLTVTDELGCSASSSITLGQFPIVPLELNDTMVFCNDTQVSIDASGPYASWLWSDGSAEPVLSVGIEGAYEVIVTDLNACQQSDTIHLVQLESILPILEDTFRVCPGDLVILDAGPGFATYAWSNGSLDRFSTTNATGMYFVDLTDANGCEVKDSTLVENYPVTAPLLQTDRLLCEGGSAQLSVLGEFIEYHWNTGDSLGVITINQPGTYGVEVVDQNTCIQKADIAVSATSGPTPKLASEGVLDCISNSLTLKADPGNGRYAYQWFGPGINPENQNLSEPLVKEPGGYSLLLQDLESGCFADTVDIQVRSSQNKPRINLMAEGMLNCNTPLVPISAEGSSEGSIYSLRWFHPNGMVLESEQEYTLLASDAGTYYFELTNTQENCTLTDSLTLLADFTTPFADAGLSATLNCQTETLSLDGSKSDQGNQYRYKWQTTEGKILSGGSGLAPLINQPGWYYLEVLDTDNGCRQTDSVLVLSDFEIPAADAGMDIVLDCFGDGIYLNGEGSAKGPKMSYQWRSVEEHTLSNRNIINPRIFDPGTYILTVLNTENGCSNRDSVNVLPPDNPPLGLNLDFNSPVCYGDLNGNISVQNVIQGSAPFLYSLNGQPFVQQNSFSNLGPGNYTIRVQDSEGCEFEVPVQLGYGREVKVDLGPDLEINLGSPVQLNLERNVPDEEIGQLIWESSKGEVPCASCTDAVIRPLETVFYQVRLEDIYGCTGSDDLNIVVKRPEAIFVPNSFSPNGDGLNDLLMVYAGQDVETIQQFRILDRWGEQVFAVSAFQPNDPLYGWDGTFRGKALNPGVFVFLVEVKFVDGQTKVYSGEINLIR